MMQRGVPRGLGQDRRRRTAVTLAASRCRSPSHLTGGYGVVRLFLSTPRCVFAISCAPRERH
ncbi:hypothetical protein EYF80_055127 [Liparis tanakae]|uniref:Uncharacterized protein n=1 Tax=Liparis tanakae TaxID=230148 RepID=A0A4Z2F0H8_9TELE|nr:hypothetical protein EYF80_055127 [Liparis tanakae]